MRLSRLSLYYLMTYLLLTGVLFLLVPSWSIRILGATRSYDAPFVRFVGAFMIALGTLVAQMIRFRLEMLYSTTLVIRVFFIAVIGWLFWSTRDPLFVSILAVVGTGVALTTAAFLLDARRRLLGNRR